MLVKGSMISIHFKLMVLNLNEASQYYTFNIVYSHKKFFITYFGVFTLYQTLCEVIFINRSNTFESVIHILLIKKQKHR